MPLTKESGRSAEAAQENNKLKEKVILTIRRWLLYKRAAEKYDPIREKRLKEEFNKKTAEVKGELDELLKKFPQYSYLVGEIEEESKNFWRIKSPYSAEDFRPKPKGKKQAAKGPPKCEICGRRHWPTESHDDSAYP